MKEARSGGPGKNPVEALKEPLPMLQPTDWEKLLMEAPRSHEQRTTPTESSAGLGKENNQEPSSADDPAEPKKAPVEPVMSPAEPERAPTEIALLELVRHNPRPTRVTRRPNQYGVGICYPIESPQDGPEVKKESGKTTLTAATKAFLLKHSLTLDAIRLIENMDNAFESSLQELLTSVTKSLEEDEGALLKPKSENVVAYKGDRGWEEATNEASTSRHEPIALEIKDGNADAIHP